MERREPSCTYVPAIYIGTSGREKTIEVHVKNNIEILLDSAIPQQVINLEKIKHLKDEGQVPR